MTDEWITRAEEVRNELRVFTGAHGGWKFRDAPEPTKMCVYRRFEYSGGKQAMLAAMPLRTSRKPKLRRYEAGLYLPFSAGAEASFGGDWGECADWLLGKQKTLSVPYDLADCRTYDQAWSLVRGLKGDALYLLSLVFDVDYAGSTSAAMAHKIVHACCPKIRGKVG